MKINHPRDIEFLKRHAARIMRHKTKRMYATSHKHNAGRIINIVAPQTICLKSNYEEVINFVSKIRNSIDKFKKITVDFCTIKKISPDGALILAAELDRWRRARKRPLFPFKYSKWDLSVKQLFSELGLFKLLKVDHPTVAHKKSQSIQFTKFISGLGSEAKLTDTLAMNLLPIIGFKYESQSWFHSLSEAMTNVVNHAYPDEFDPGIPFCKNRWWMTGCYCKMSSQLTIIIYDQGVGIPATLPRFELWESIQEMLKSFNLPNKSDSTLIKAAFAIRRSGTGNLHRGNGLMQLLELLLDCACGQLRVISGHGEYILSRTDGIDTETLNEFGCEIGGTFIEWTIPVEYGGSDVKNHCDC